MVYIKDARVIICLSMANVYQSMSISTCLGSISSNLGTYLHVYLYIVHICQSCPYLTTYFHIFLSMVDTYLPRVHIYCTVPIYINLGTHILIQGQYLHRVHTTCIWSTYYTNLGSLSTCPWSIYI